MDSHQYVRVTRHAELQAARRHISSKEIAAALRWGRPVRRDGFLFLFVGRQEVARYSLPPEVEGLTALLTSDRTTLITVYRNRSALNEIRKKPERTWVRRVRRQSSAAF